MVRRRFIRENPDVLQRFSADLLPLMLQVHGGTVMAQARLSLALKCTSCCQTLALLGRGDAMIQGMYSCNCLRDIQKRPSMPECSGHIMP